LRGTEDFLVEGVEGNTGISKKGKRKICDLCYVIVKAVFGNERARVLKIRRWKEVSVEITNKMQPCNRIYYSTVH